MIKNGIQGSVAFTGKERDSETGFGYFGARYMDHELMTMWLSVDPMADKYPSISPYAYCAWNPVKLVDPKGEELQVPPRATRPMPSRVGYMAEHDKIKNSRERITWGQIGGRTSGIGRPENRSGGRQERLPHSPAEYIFTSHSASDGMNYQYTKDSKFDFTLAQMAVDLLQNSKSYKEALENGNYSVGNYSKSYFTTYGYHQEKYQLIQFDDPEVQRMYQNALKAWNYLESEIYRQHSVVCGDKYLLSLEGIKMLSKIGANPMQQVLSNYNSRPHHIVRSKSNQVELLYPSN